MASLSIEQRLFIRADANDRIGVGHVMRCFALAQEWMRSGGSCTFVGSIPSLAIREKILSEGIGFISLDAPQGSPSDLKALLREVHDFPGESYVVIDGYEFDHNYEGSILAIGCVVLRVDDHNHRKKYNPTILFNQNVGAESLQYNCPADTTLLLGSQYVLLREEFVNFQNSKRKQPPRAQKILVTLGGADPENVTSTIARAMTQLEDISVRFIMGPVNSFIADVEAILDEVDYPHEMLINSDKMSAHMEWADMAIVAAGSTCWELCRAGLPFMSVVVADNQVPISTHLGQTASAVDLGWFDKLTEKEWVEAINSLIIDHKKRTELSSRASKLIDGQGAARVVQAIIGATNK